MFKGMSEKVNEFIIFCIEIYKAEYGISGEEAYDLFDQYEIFDYLKGCYDGLHTQGRPYILKEIEETINVRRNKSRVVKWGSEKVPGTVIAATFLFMAIDEHNRRCRSTDGCRLSCLFINS